MEIQKQLMLCSLLGLISMYINIRTQCTLTDEDLSDLRESKGRHAQFSSDMCKFYRDRHVKSDGLCGIFLHDPISFVALVRTDLFTYKKGVGKGGDTGHLCRPYFDGPRTENMEFKQSLDRLFCRWNSSNPWTGYSADGIQAILGQVILQMEFKQSLDRLFCRWNSSNPWTGYSPISFALTVDVDQVVSYIKNLLMKR